jgi:hypothetical protein
MRQTGEILPVEITDAYAFTMLGRVQTHEVVPGDLQLETPEVLSLESLTTNRR